MGRTAYRHSLNINSRLFCHHATIDEREKVELLSFLFPIEFQGNLSCLEIYCVQRGLGDIQLTTLIPRRQCMHEFFLKRL